MKHELEFTPTKQTSYLVITDKLWNWRVITDPHYIMRFLSLTITMTAWQRYVLLLCIKQVRSMACHRFIVLEIYDRSKTKTNKNRLHIIANGFVFLCFVVVIYTFYVSYLPISFGVSSLTWGNRIRIHRMWCPCNFIQTFFKELYNHNKPIIHHWFDLLATSTSGFGSLKFDEQVNSYAPVSSLSTMGRWTANH